MHFAGRLLIEEHPGKAEEVHRGAARDYDTHPAARVPSTRPGGEGVALEATSHAIRVQSMIQFVSKLWPSSNEKDCSQRAEAGVMSFQSKRTMSARP